jgi:glutamate synthase domain-containing protein 1
MAKGKSVVGEDVLAAVRAMVDRGSADAKTSVEWGEAWQTKDRPTRDVIRRAIGAGLMEPCQVHRRNMCGTDKPVPAYRIVPKPVRKR